MDETPRIHARVTTTEAALYGDLAVRVGARDLSHLIRAVLAHAALHPGTARRAVLAQPPMPRGAAAWRKS